MKALKVVKNILIGILAVVYFAFAVVMAVLLLKHNKFGITQFEDKSLIMLRDKVTSEKYNKGDLLIVESRKIDELEKGDEVFVYQVDDAGETTIDFGIIGEVHPEIGTKGAISFVNGAAYEMEFIAGEQIEIYPKIGTYLSIVQSQWGFLFIILVPCFLIFIYQLYALIVEIKYGDDK